MSDINKVILIGRLTKDPEYKQVNNSSLSNFSIANNKTYMSNGEKREEVNFFDCEVWGKLADTANRYLQKGSKIAIEGRLKQNTWNTPDGKKASRVSIHIESFQFLGGGQGQGGSQNQQNQYDPQYNGQYTDAEQRMPDSYKPDEDDGDLF